MSEQPKQLKRVGQVKAPSAWDPAPWEDHHAHALQALHAGVATPDQQRAALQWIIEGAAGHNDWAYRPSSERDTAMFLGRQFVAKQIVKLLNINLSALKRTNQNG